LSTQEVK